MRHDAAPLLLDTHVWVWLVSDDARVSRAPCVAVIEAAAPGSRVFVSPISVWEIALLEKKGRLRFPVECMQWVRSALDESGFLVAPFTPEIAIDSVRLPGNFHSDPADRIIIATARAMGAVLVTQDRLILKYGAQNHVRTLSV